MASAHRGDRAESTFADPLSTLVQVGQEESGVKVHIANAKFTAVSHSNCLPQALSSCFGETERFIFFPSIISLQAGGLF